MKQNEKRRLREESALRKIMEPVRLDQKLLRKQINNASNLVQIVNDEIGDHLVGAVMVLEVFEWLPKGEYNIKIIIQ